MSKRKHEDSNSAESSSQSKIDDSNKRRQDLQKLFIALDMEEKMRLEVQKKEKRIEKQRKQQEKLTQVADNALRVSDEDNVYIDNLEVSVGATIKNAAISKHPLYHQLDSNYQSIICLGLNSILDLSAKYPERQTLLFNKKQWSDLKKKYPAKLLNDADYLTIVDTLSPMFDAHKEKQSVKRNWNSMFKQVIILQAQYNAELDDSFRDIDFCLNFYQSLLLLQKHHNYLFKEDIGKSEWDLIVKFWGPILERLFVDTGLRLKWGDTVLTMKDVETIGTFKVDVRVINDTMVSQGNKEEDLSFAEVAKENLGTMKYQSDRCKLFSESKVVTDNFLYNGHDVDAVYSIQFCGFEMMIMSLSLSEKGLYIGNEVHYVHIDDRLQSYRGYLDTVKQLLCFRDEAVKASNVANELISQKASRRDSKKGKDKPKELPRSSWTRGNWIPPRRRESPPPCPPFPRMCSKTDFFYEHPFP